MGKNSKHFFDILDKLFGKKEDKLMEKREFMRFDVGLKIEARENDQECVGLIKDFSKKGLRAVFDEFGPDLNSPLKLKIQEPGSGEWIDASAVVVWKRQAKGKCDVGLKISAFPPENKAKILEYGYLKWLKERVFSS